MLAALTAFLAPYRDGIGRGAHAPARCDLDNVVEAARDMSVEYPIAIYMPIA